MDCDPPPRRCNDNQDCVPPEVCRFPRDVFEERFVTRICEDPRDDKFEERDVGDGEDSGEGEDSGDGEDSGEGPDDYSVLRAPKKCGRDYLWTGSGCVPRFNLKS